MDRQPEKKIFCRACRGSGYIGILEKNITYNCPVCNPALPEPPPAPKPYICTKCQGEGTVTDFNKNITYPCPLCHSQALSPIAPPEENKNSPKCLTDDSGLAETIRLMLEGK